MNFIKIAFAGVLVATLVGASGCSFSMEISGDGDEEEVVIEEVEVEESEEEVVDEFLVPDDWQLFESEELGFSISYPGDWEHQEYETGVHFGTPESKTGGYLWGVGFNDPSVYSLEDLIARMGSQFNDRKEVRNEVAVNDYISGTMVTVTTNKYDDWVNKTVYFEVGKDKLFSIGNGAIIDERFETFYKSFELK